MRRSRTPEPDFIPGHRVDLFTSGRPALTAMREAILGAARSVCMESYLIRDDPVGRSFSDALAARARAGLPVHLIYDSVGSIETPGSFFASLEGAGVHVHEFHPVAPWKPRWPTGMNQRDHRKILIVDGRVGFVGGLNIGEEYDGVEGSTRHWRDTHARIAGPAIADLLAIFRDQWRRATGRVPDVPVGEPSPEDAGRAALRFHPIGPVAGQRIARPVFLRALLSATRSIHLTYGYFLPERRILRALRRQSRRGVEVVVVVPSVTDHPLVRLAGQSVYRRLLGSGVRIFERLNQPLHAKCLVVDGRRALLGSANLDARSFFLNYEVAVEILDDAAGLGLEQQFERDLDESEEVDPATWRARPLRTKLLQKIARVLRPFL